MLADVRRIVRLAGVYTFGDLFVRAAGVLLLPLYAAYLTPREYGIVSVATSVAGLATIVFAMGLNGAVLRFYFELDEAERRGFFGTLWTAMVIVPALLTVVLDLAHGWPISEITGEVALDPYLRLAFWIAFTGAAFLTFPPEVFRASERPGAYVAFSLGQFLLVGILTVVFVVVLGRGAAGALWARLLGGLAIGSIGAWSLRPYLRPRLSWPDLRRAAAYGLPLMPHFLSHWVLTASDRLILGRYVSLADVGMYTVGYQVGAILMLFVLAGNNAILPLFGRLDPRNREQVTTLTRIVTYYVAAMVVLGLAIALFAREIIGILAGRYGPAAPVVPWVVLAYVFFALYIPPLNAVSLIAGRTTRIPLITGAAAGMNILLNILLIPRFSIMGAAFATTVSYAALFILSFLYAHGTHPLPYEYRRIGLVLGAAGTAYGLGIAGSLALPAGALAARAAALALFPALLWLIGFPSRAERRALEHLQLGLSRRVRLLIRHGPR